MQATARGAAEFQEFRKKRVDRAHASESKSAPIFPRVPGIPEFPEIPKNSGSRGFAGATSFRASFLGASEEFLEFQKFRARFSRSIVTFKARFGSRMPFFEGYAILARTVRGVSHLRSLHN